MAVAEVTPEELHQVLAEESRPPLIDVRTAIEFREVHLAGAQNIPFDELSPERVAAMEGVEMDSKTYVICKAGIRSRKACEKLSEAGFANAISVQGGTDGCLSAGLPVQHGQQRASLEKQVRIVAGSIALVSSILAITSSPYFAAIAAVTGAGLIFSALTNWCGMGMLLAKMPWNR